MKTNRAKRVRLLIGIAFIAALVSTYFLTLNMNQERLYIYSIVPDDDDPTPNAMIKADITDLVMNQGYKLLNEHYIWVPETKRPTLSPDDWVRIKKGFVRAAKLVLPKSEWTDLEAFEPIQSTRYLVSEYKSAYPSHIYESTFYGKLKKIVIYSSYSDTTIIRKIDIMFVCLPEKSIPGISFEPCDHKLWDQFEYGELDFLFNLKDL